jgi:hypothetical protein
MGARQHPPHQAPQTPAVIGTTLERLTLDVSNLSVLKLHTVKILHQFFNKNNGNKREIYLSVEEYSSAFT